MCRGSEDCMTKIFDRIKLVLEIVVGTIFVALVLLTIIQVFMRYVFNSPIMIADELMRLLLIWGTLMGCGLAIYYSKHISLDIIIERLPGKSKMIVNLLAWTIIIGISIFYLCKGTMIAFASKNTVLTALGLSKLYYFGAIPVSAVFWILFSVQKAAEALGVGKNSEVSP